MTAQTATPQTAGQTAGGENFVNRTIFTGDNLNVLRGMNSDSVDLIYLDPPFNSNRNYSAPVGSKAAGAAFKDTWTLSDVDLAWHGEIADQNQGVYDVITAARTAHGKGMMSYLIMMAVRLIEMERVLKPSGSIYLHCDDTASHYLKMLMDCIFGRDWFRNEIIWKRTAAGKSGARRFGRVHDVILYYAGESATWNTQWMPHDPAYVARAYRNEDERGRWQADQLLAANTSTGESGDAWGGIDPTPKGKHWYTPTQGGMSSFLKDYIPGWPDAYPTVHDRLDALDEYGFVHWPKGGAGVPRLKRYLASTKGRAVEDIFSDIGRLEANSKENVGYPTQKPVALVARLIAASSNPGDVVLDPFAGCATAAVAAEKLDRQWVGIDISPKAAELVNERLERELGLMGTLAVLRTDLPVRTDLGELPHYRTHKHTLFGQQEARCNGCGIEFPFRNLTVDHIVPKSKGGTDHLSNLQLLCGACNSQKGVGSQAEFLAKREAQKQGQSFLSAVHQNGAGRPVVDEQSAAVIVEQLLAALQATAAGQSNA